MQKTADIHATYTVIPTDPNATHFWDVADEQVVGGASGVRIAYREADRDMQENDYIDIVADPATLRGIATAIMRKADEQEAAQ